MKSVAKGNMVVIILYIRTLLKQFTQCHGILLEKQADLGWRIMCLKTGSKWKVSINAHVYWVVGGGQKVVKGTDCRHSCISWARSSAGANHYGCIVFSQAMPVEDLTQYLCLSLFFQIVTNALIKCIKTLWFANTREDRKIQKALERWGIWRGK